jgi:hypothetical protein
LLHEHDLQDANTFHKTPGSKSTRPFDDASLKPIRLNST